MKSVNCSKPGYTSITCSNISNIPYNLIFSTKFNDSSMLITIISCDFLNLSLANEYVGDVIIPIQVIKYSQNFLQEDYLIKLQYLNKIKLYIFNKKYHLHFCYGLFQLSSDLLYICQLPYDHDPDDSYFCNGIIPLLNNFFLKTMVLGQH